MSSSNRQHPSSLATGLGHFGLFPPPGATPYDLGIARRPWRGIVMTTTPRLLDRIGRVSATSAPIFGWLIVGADWEALPMSCTRLVRPLPRGWSLRRRLGACSHPKSIRSEPALSTHSEVLCAGAASFTTGSEQASCNGSVGGREPGHTDSHRRQWTGQERRPRRYPGIARHRSRLHVCSRQPAGDWQ